AAPTKESKPGDLIEIIRGNYSHWAVYVGNGYVVHFGAPKSQSGSSIGGVDGIVMKEKLEDVAGKDKWRVNNSLDKKYKPLPPDEIVKKACSLVGVSLKYHLTKYNCEHFATEMRYGKAESRQVGHCWCFFFFFFNLSCPTAGQTDESSGPLVLDIFYFNNRDYESSDTPEV
uniref:LRAT domain-containing protein n=1 Tax=Oryzias latipes TaxID=8090 RepID=A0A3P9H9B1_ORYLA